MSGMVEASRCPFCGSDDIIMIDGDYDHDAQCERMHGYCENCHAWGRGVTDYVKNPDSPFEAWNRRVMLWPECTE